MAELETHLTIAVRLNFIVREEAMEASNLAQDVGKMLNRPGAVAGNQVNGRDPKPGTLNPVGRLCRCKRWVHCVFERTWRR